MDNWISHIYQRMTKSMTLQELEMYIEKLMPGFRTDWDDHFLMFVAIEQRRDLLNGRTVITPELMHDLERVNSKLCIIQADVECRTRALYQQWIEFGLLPARAYVNVGFSVSIQYDKENPIYPTPKDVQNSDSDFIKMFGIFGSVLGDFFSADSLFDTAHSEVFESIELSELTVPAELQDCEIPFCRVMLELLNSNMISFSDAIRVSNFKSYVSLSIRENHSNYC